MQIRDSLPQHFAALPVQTILDQLRTTANGLTTNEAENRLEKEGFNVLREEKKLHIVLEFLSNFKNPLVLILLLAAIVSFVIGEIVNAIIIGTIVIFSVILNFFQEYRANQAAQKLKENVSTKSEVIRDGKEKELDIKNICVGDIVVLRAGDMIPADARIIESKDFFVNQSSLTGESLPVEKTTAPLHKQNASLSDLTNIVFSGTNVISGSAKALVIAIAGNTEFGKIAEKLSETPLESEFTIGMKNFSLLIMRTTIFFVLFIFFFNTLLKHADFFESFTFAIAVAVGLTPELLPMIMSVTMSKGSLSMAKKGVIVKKLAAIPDFGGMDVLCTDKTGTLTEDKIELVTYTDVFGKHSENVLHHAYLNSFYQTGVKNPMDQAVVSFKKESIDDYEKIDEIPFDFERRKTSVVVAQRKKRYLITKGAPEEMMKVCTKYQSNDVLKPLDPHTIEKINKQYHELSNQGYRVLAVASKEIHDSKTVYKKDDETNLAFLGFISFLDPAKKGIKESLFDLEKMGIEIKVITGDNELVTQKICRDVGLVVKGVLLGSAIETMSEETLRVEAKKTTIFARCSPNEKNRIITALKESGHVVGYLGDGVNDAPSLKTAHVGISVSNAVDVAKESADMILTHKSLHELKEGVLEGRKTFGNTMKYIMMGISSNFGNMFSVLGAVLFLPFLPMLPIQILLNNLMYDISQISIPTDNVDEIYIQKPKRWNMKFIKHFMFIFGPISSLFDFATFFTLYVVFKSSAPVFQTGWFLESLATQTLIIHVIRTRHIPFLQSTASKYLLITTILVVIIGWVMPYTFVGEFFQFAKLPFPIMLAIAGIVTVYMISVELGKRVFYKYYSS